MSDAKMWLLLFATGGILFLPLSGIGCWAPNQPVTEISVNPVWKTFSLKNSKDVSLKVEGAKFNKADGAFEIAKLELTDTASSVIAQQIMQMQVWREQMETANEGIEKTFTGLQNIANVIAPLGMQYMQTRQAMALDPPGAVKIMDAAGRLIGVVQGGQFIPAAPPPPPPAPVEVIPQEPPPDDDDTDGPDLGMIGDSPSDRLAKRTPLRAKYASVEPDDTMWHGRPIFRGRVRGGLAGPDGR